MFSSVFVCVFVCQLNNSKSYRKILMRFSGKVGRVIGKTCLVFGGGPDHRLDPEIKKIFFFFFGGDLDPNPDQ